jgi:AcrR family transcriptional regulator
MDVVRERGFAGTRVSDIATAAGTSPALVLYHYSSLADVLVAALTWSDDTWYAQIEQSLTALDPLDALVQLAAETANNGAEFGDWALWLEVWVKARHDERVEQVRAELDARWRGLLRGIVVSGIEAGLFDAPDPDQAAFRLASSMDGLAVQGVLGDPPELTPDRMAQLWLAGAARELGVDPAEAQRRLAAMTTPV